jgi:NhaC family Na+:H+ antiporter
MLRVMQSWLGDQTDRWGRYPVTLVLSIVMAAIFCNQTISTMMCADLMKQTYLERGGSRQELAIDMENSVILMACFIPWSLGCSVPLSFMGVDFHALPYAVFMYALPLCYLFTKKRLMKKHSA